MTGKELPCKGKIPKNIIVRNQEKPFDKISNTFYLRKLPPPPPPEEGGPPPLQYTHIAQK